MGMYINPKDNSKESWLMDNNTEILNATPTKLPSQFPKEVQV